MNALHLPSLAPVLRSAEVSACGRYRWWLRRQWDDGNHQTVAFVMLNPSLANDAVDDPTLQRCMGFARDWGYSTLLVTNLYAFITSDPEVLFQQTDPVGYPRNDLELHMALEAALVVCAWGARAEERRVTHVRTMWDTYVPDKELWCLGTTKGGAPKHPLYLPRRAQLTRL